MRAFGQGIGPDAARDDAALVRRVEQHPGAHLIGDLAHLGHGMGKEVEAAAHGDDPGPHGMGQVTKCRQIKGIAVPVDRGGMGGQAIEPRAARGVVGDMAADAGGRRDDAVAGPGQRHEAVEVGQRAGGHAHLGVLRVEDLSSEFGADHLDALDRLQAHLVLVAGVAERGGTIGKRLDFLSQELNREANTIASKAVGIAVTDAAVGLKLAIEQLREQVQNLE